MLWSIAGAPGLWFIMLSFVRDSQEHSCRSCVRCFLVPRKKVVVAGEVTEDWDILGL